MAARITDIFSLLIITFLCIGLVEGGYQALEYFVLRPPATKTKPSDNLSDTEDLITSDAQKKTHDYRVILQRNLFGPPPGKAEPVVQEVPEEQPEIVQPTSLNIVLMGTISNETETSRAIILDKSSRKQELYEVGDAIQGALVKEILRGKVILTFNGRDEMLDMSEAANVRPSYAVPVKKTGARVQRSNTAASSGVAQPRRQVVLPRRTPRRVTTRPRAVQPSQGSDAQ